MITSVIIIKINDTNSKLLDSTDYSKNALEQIVKALDYKIVGNSFHKFSPQGVTGVLLLSTSHISIHTWPENSSAVIEFLTCSEVNDTHIDKLTKLVNELYSDSNISIQKIIQ